MKSTARESKKLRTLGQITLIQQTLLRLCGAVDALGPRDYSPAGREEVEDARDNDREPVLTGEDELHHQAKTLGELITEAWEHASVVATACSATIGDDVLIDFDEDGDEEESHTLQLVGA